MTIKQNRNRFHFGIDSGLWVIIQICLGLCFFACPIPRAPCRNRPPSSRKRPYLASLRACTRGKRRRHSGHSATEESRLNFRPEESQCHGLKDDYATLAYECGLQHSTRLSIFEHNTQNDRIPLEWRNYPKSLVFIRGRIEVEFPRTRKAGDRPGRGPPSSPSS